ncbi:UDP-2,3-diacylglucosamine diphosphatase [Vibrio sp.]|uniref:UDP-2,3-diacylglucosamine hydrolase n=1 Tax=Vibrio viridaestus TaxID=2487322 RepID=A0A3N9U1E8_9VIBR|nr:UDP-2,3-diacylglucosamine diphosphatase [Vibrio viridaestus]MDC0609558.1 UDP-2,3-diacylglucosamine diphosphatase [Vibrio sp.]RQW63282.1 UDP-2,3-diacylglucosamine diphosphatase [Vibrio viridaestus]
MHTLFISDLHLSPDRPDLTTAFCSFVTDYAYKADALYILGDLFDFWVGDDDQSDFAKQVKEAICQLIDSGVPCYFLHGNRDFLVGQKFCQDTGLITLPEETVIKLYGTSTLLMHGDTLCTEDIKYLAFREKVHKPWLQKLYKLLPFSLKLKIVAKIKGSVREDKKTKQLTIMDVTPSAVSNVMKKYGVDYLIHGHTHRPDHHVDGKDSSSEKHRIVLGDWNKFAYALRVDNNFDMTTIKYEI